MEVPAWVKWEETYICFCACSCGASDYVECEKLLKANSKDWKEIREQITAEFFQLGDK